VPASLHGSSLSFTPSDAVAAAAAAVAAAAAAATVC